MVDETNNVPEENKEEEKGGFLVHPPDPLPGENSDVMDEKKAAIDGIELKRKSDRIPKPAPKDGEISEIINSAPVSTDTIYIKGEEPEKEKTGLLADDLGSEKEPEKEEKILKIFCHNCEQKIDLTSLKPFQKVNCPSCNVEIIVPKWFDNYLLEEPGGVGGMATVYRALDLALDREVAVKVLDPEVASESERSELFLHEARTAATINHYAVLPIYTCGEFEKQPYIVMQFMNGGSLDTLQEGKNILPIEDVVKWTRDIAEGLDNARRHGIIHHDIKPGNIMLDNDGNAKIGDFGIAHAIHDLRSDSINKLTKTWASPHYVSPEKVINGTEDFRGDIYSLGATIYQLITGHTPFEIDDMDELIKYRLNNSPPAARSHRPEIPQDLSDLISSMMVHDVEKRPSYREIINGLNAYLDTGKKKLKLSEGKKSKSSSILGGKRPGLTKTKVDRKKLDAVIGKHQKKRGSWVLLSKVLSIVFILLAGGYLLYKYGYLDKYLGLKEEKSSMDYIPESTRLFAVGDSDNAALAAEMILNDANAELPARKQAAVQLSIAAYLNNKARAKDFCSIIVDRLSAAGVKSDDSYLALVKFLADSSISAENFKNRLKGSKELTLLGNIAIYIRNIYDKAPELEILRSSRAYRSSSMLVSEEFWGNAWRKRVVLWGDWMKFGGDDSSGLEPLIVENRLTIESKERETVYVPRTDDGTGLPGETHIYVPPPDEAYLKTIDINDLTISNLKKNRRFAGNRPRPRDLSFPGQIRKEYLDSIPGAKRNKEKKRLEQVSGIKSYLCSLMMRMPFEGKKIKLRNGKVLQGSVMANVKYLSVRSPKGERKRLDWGALSFDQYLDFCDYYAKTRTEADAGPGVSKSKQRFEGAWDYLRMGILCDWYGRYPDAVKYAKKAMSVDRRIENDVKRYLMSNK